MHCNTSGIFPLINYVCMRNSSQQIFPFVFINVNSELVGLMRNTEQMIHELYTIGNTF